eukprot:CAMPEP_0194056152 /NCGR_PEP_ID=MMETSP0009_2-20130614/59153_1 /TAXON_ID=210454 /ORGANISM="Grammatophora oceanica, Strain CCMP 410" /LENGTH=115 /DNA_ID=CAMNT_0038705397 /DNA_START=9 /DNA_END=353 /DNA_ORIENTATION=+
MSNLVENKVLIGIVEHMSDSLELLQHVLDMDDELLPAFELFGMNTTATRRNNNGTSTTASKRTITANKSKKFSTRQVVTELKRDVEFMTIFEEYVKYESLIYEFARVELHERQVQ